MSGNHKRSNVDTGNGGDILVTLPRELIHRILDWVPVRDAARTSILSSKWRYIWSDHPRLILDALFFEANFKSKRAPVDSYVNAINSVILLHNGPIQKFHLYIPNEQSDMNQHVFQWLVYLSKNGINNLVPDSRHTSPCTLPSHVLSHPELKSSRLRNCIVKLPKGFGGFSKLTYLQLDRLSFTPGIFGNVVAPAPALKRLTFSRCTGIQHFKIHSPKLKTFTIVGSSDVELTNYENIPDLTVLAIVLGERVSIRKQCMTLLLQRFPRLEELYFDGFSLEASAARGDGARAENASHSVTSKWGSPTLTNLTTFSIFSINGLTTELGFIEMLLASAPILEQMSINYRETMDAIQKFDISNKLLDFTRASTEARIKYVEKPRKMGIGYPSNNSPPGESSFWR